MKRYLIPFLRKYISEATELKRTLSIGSPLIEGSSKDQNTSHKSVNSLSSHSPLPKYYFLFRIE